MTTLHDHTFSSLEREMSGLSPVHVRTLWRALHREAKIDFQNPLRQWLNGREVQMELPTVAREIVSNDSLTRKLLVQLGDGQMIETVLMGYPGRKTICVSTQAGCAMGCVFCATGQNGFSRHLRPGEIVAQVLLGQRTLRARDEPGLRNLVLMGMGEPLHNYDAVMTALEIVSDTRGTNIGPSRITISTVGVVPGILRLAEEKRPYHLAVSLHGATEEERGALVPVSKKWPLAELMAACRFYGEKTGKRIFFEWTLIAGKNDSQESARRLADLLRGIDAHVNLIPLNPTAGFAGAATERMACTDFQRVLRDAGIPSTVRQRRGIDVAAGCGQLAGKQKTGS
ncbi:MAG TPA: 23S rRNA (adenine(2503)-C(2))-methyltransferase RlmN [Chthoniobacterales bacterium]